MKNKPIVSVLMPVYNAERFLLAAINSILNQTFKDFEFIIIDDGSTDRSLDIIGKFKDERIHVISLGNNNGITAVLNLGLNHVRGDYVARMDADDIALPDRLAKQVEFLDTHADNVAVGSRVLLIDPDGWPIRPFSEHTSHQAIDQAHLCGEGGSAICHPSVLMRTQAVKQIDGYRTKFRSAQDIDLFLRLAEIGLLANLPEIFLKYRMHPKSIGHSRNIEQKQSVRLAIAEAYERRGIPLPMNDPLKQGVSLSVSQMHCKWAWWALEAGNLATARKNALWALSKNPISMENWKVMACTLRGY
jgi:glycosyltransferase involved in cell wall biosynthesis